MKSKQFKDYFTPLLTKTQFKSFAEAFVLAGKLRKYLRKQKKNETEVGVLLNQNIGGCVPEHQARNVRRIKRLLRERANLKVE